MRNIPDPFFEGSVLAKGRSGSEVGEMLELARLPPGPLSTQPVLNVSRFRIPGGQSVVDFWERLDSQGRVAVVSRMERQTGGSWLCNSGRVIEIP